MEVLVEVDVVSAGVVVVGEGNEPQLIFTVAHQKLTHSFSSHGIPRVKSVSPLFSGCLLHFQISLCEKAWQVVIHAFQQKSGDRVQANVWTL